MGTIPTSTITPEITMIRFALCSVTLALVACGGNPEVITETILVPGDTEVVTVTVPVQDTDPQDLDGDGFAVNVDCNDLNPYVNPDAEEVCNDIDDNCDGIVDSDAVDAKMFTIDYDQDGHGSMVDTPQFGCYPLPGYADVPQDDCDDTDPSVHPGAVDEIDGLDADCDGTVECEYLHTGFPDAGEITTTMVNISRVGPANIAVNAGSQVTYTLELANENCGWASVSYIGFAVSSWGNGPWIESVEDDAVLMEMQVSTGASYLNDGYNIIEPYGEQLFYQFSDNLGLGLVDTAMNTIWLAPGDSELVTFTFTNTQGLLFGDQFTIHPTFVLWNDFDSGNTISPSLWLNYQLTVDVL
jgi:hypothetical protein